MLEAVLSFLGGSAFRMIWGEVSSFFVRKQEHEQEVQRMQMQAEMDDRAHSRNLESLRLQSELGIKEIQIQSDADVSIEEAVAFTEAVKQSYKPSGIRWIDAWNASIRPQYAEVALALWVLKLYQQGFIMDGFDIGLMAVIAGYFFADRTLRKTQLSK
jgi:hypothetical protein